jgi:pyrimidine-specific ribonucleoside hydrolase
MKKLLILLIIILLNPRVWSQPIPVKLNHRIIIDTDGAIDDMRAISYLLERPEITVSAVLISDGSLPPEEGAEKVTSLLNDLNIKNIPVACGPVLKDVNPPWRQFNRSFSWAKTETKSSSSMDAAGCLEECLANTNEKIVLVCLGPLTNIALMIKDHKAYTRNIERIIWYNESVNPPEGFNYDCDRESAENVLKSGIRIDAISNLAKSYALFDTSLYDICTKSGTKLAMMLNYVFSQKPVQEKLHQNHFRLADDLAALYLTNPELFSINTMPSRLNVRYDKDYDVNGVREAIGDMIRGTYSTGQNVVFSSFPVNREQFRYDVRPLIDSAIARYGLEEWKANVITDEFHGHLGVFSIVGAKMGIKAREIFGVGPDMLTVVTFAGSIPPYSCLNDGIQVSTGATLGMGTIHLSGDSIRKPSAIFTYKGRSVRLTLKKEYLDKVDSDINEGILKFGLLDDGYWKLIRNNALKYWLNWDRNKIFDIEEISE